ncbi:hypothetical protein QBC37DRAFT_457423 [Rhypophila decipiens]|uniref:C2H2-type domain-containing protein n=1 Tax=Rhypophila decipiens TaxID=261697 RepID=A0AAN6Y029_9PEZI|nr:hypothetical protein QBC37DRAFT_457423 [Rhypophila decipiens]
MLRSGVVCHDRYRFHVGRDMHFYSCISPDCASPPQLFSRLEEWKSHMDREHSRGWLQDVHTPIRWHCQACEGEDQWFEEEEAIEMHIEQMHPEYSKGPELEAWKETFEVKAPRPAYTCPVCNSIPDKLAAILKPDAEGRPTAVATNDESLRNELLKHIAQHLKEIGLVSIHFLYDADEDAASSRASAANNINSLPAGRWLDGNLVPPVPSYLDEEYHDEWRL